MTQPCHYALTIVLVQSLFTLFGQTEVRSALSDSQDGEELSGWHSAGETGVAVRFIPGMMLHQPRPHGSDPQSLAHRRSTGRMSYRMLGGRAVRFQIISKLKTLKNIWSGEFGWILFMQFIIFYRGLLQEYYRSFSCRYLFSPGKDPESRFSHPLQEEETCDLRHQRLCG